MIEINKIEMNQKQMQREVHGGLSGSFAESQVGLMSGSFVESQVGLSRI